jgi:flagellar hook-length control protein FliK
MNPLSALGGSGRTSMAPAATGDGAGKEGSSGQDFASMMENDAHATSATTPRTAQKSQGKAASQSDKRAEPGSPDSPPEPARAGHDHGTSADGRAAGETGETAAAKPETKTADHKDSDEDTWPPAGLASIGMAVLPALNAAMPGAAGAPLPGAGLATNLASTVAGLLGDQGGLPGAAGAAGTQPAPAATGASAALTHGGFSAMLAQAATSSRTPAQGADATVPLVALAALAGTADSKADDAGTGAGADPINLLAMATTAPTSRVLGGSAPFSGSPTATPDLHDAQFDDALGARMSWLAEQKIGHAHIRINPAELGPVEVRLHLNGDQVNASFLSAQPEVRHALENSLPRLREMLGQHGFQLGQADVGQQQQQASQGHPFAAGDNGNPDADELLQGTAGIPAVLLHQRGLLDAYA